MGHVVPIFKKGNKHEVSNYRPISLTSLVMKTFERIIKDELLKHVHRFIDNRQHGFLAQKSCTTNLVGLCNSLALLLNGNIHSDVVYFDFAKAFDSVNHDIILYKLKTKFNVDGRLLKFLLNYLKDRQQCVVIGNRFSCQSVLNQEFHRVPFWDPYYLYCSLMILLMDYLPGHNCHFMLMTQKSGVPYIWNVITLFYKRTLTISMTGL